MPAKKNFKDDYVGFVLDVALARGKVSNRMIAKRLGVDEKTIRCWRKDKPDFDEAFIEAMSLLREMVNSVARGNLKLRKKNIVKKTPEGESVITEDVLPTHNDIAVYSRIGLDASIVAEKNHQRDILREIIKKNISGELSSIDAAKLIEAEGIPIPKTLMLEVKKEIGAVDDEYSSMAETLGDVLALARKRRDEENNDKKE